MCIDFFFDVVYCKLIYDDLAIMSMFYLHCSHYLIYIILTHPVIHNPCPYYAYTTGTLPDLAPEDALSSMNPPSREASENNFNKSPKKNLQISLQGEVRSSSYNKVKSHDQENATSKEECDSSSPKKKGWFGIFDAADSDDEEFQESSDSPPVPVAPSNTKEGLYLSKEKSLKNIDTFSYSSPLPYNDQRLPTSTLESSMRIKTPIRGRWSVDATTQTDFIAPIASSKCEACRIM
jgi:hypothetical protein